MGKKNTEASGEVLVKSSFWYIVSSFLSRAMVFITTPIFTRLLTKREYADFSVYASWQSILIIICGLEMYISVNRVRLDCSEEELDSYISSSIVLSSIFTSVLFLFYLMFPDLVTKVLLLDRKYILVMFIYLYTFPVFSMFQAKQRIEYRYKLSAGISFFVLFIATSLSVVLANLMETDRLLGRILGQYMPYVVVGLGFYIYFLIKNHTIRLTHWKTTITLGAPLVFSFLGGQVLLNSDKLIVKHMSTSEEVAWLVLATTGSHIMLLLAQTFNNAWAPWFFDKLQEKDYPKIRKSFSLYLAALIFCTFAVLLMGPELILLLGGKSFSESVYLLPAYMSCGIFTALTSQYVNLETYHKKTNISAVLTVVVAVLNVVLDIIGVQIWGYHMVCYATVVCQILLVFLHAWATKGMDSETILPLKLVATVIGAVILTIAIPLILYQNSILRFEVIGLLITAFCGVVISQRDRIKMAIQSFRRQKGKRSP